LNNPFSKASVASTVLGAKPSMAALLVLGSFAKWKNHAMLILTAPERQN
jgi:hypothetical protein